MNEDETVPFIITVLSQHASKSHTFNGVHYRQSPSAEVKPKVTAQEADERINLSQWEKNRESVCACMSIYTDPEVGMQVYDTAERRDAQE